MTERILFELCYFCNPKIVFKSANESFEKSIFQS